MKGLQKYIAEQRDLYKKNFRETGAWWWGFQEAMDKIEEYLEEKRNAKRVERNNKRISS